MAFPALVENVNFLKKEPPQVVKETPSLIYVDGRGNIGSLVVDFALKNLLEKIKTSGVVMVALFNSTPVLRSGSIAKNLAERGFLTLIFENGGKEMTAPPGGIDPILATNPIGIGIPTAKDPIVIDMATSKRAWGEVRLAKRFRHKLPPETYLDKNGNFTLDPDKAYSVVPMADYKGFALALAIEIMTGSLVNSLMGVRKNIPGTYQAARRGLIIIVVDPSCFTNINKFRKENSKLIRMVKQSRKMKGTERILIPGERARNNLKKNLKEGYLEIEETLYQKLLSFN
ncbi:Ldh family oxidoreductase [Candidatus Gottesmanbacteria bacterium]|nr:Ldh family oxidoreductase [Candidatus Gottesmanbacteria bacterium]